jgi:hypothetical protein
VLRSEPDAATEGGSSEVLANAVSGWTWLATGTRRAGLRADFFLRFLSACFETKAHPWASVTLSKFSPSHSNSQSGDRNLAISLQVLDNHSATCPDFDSSEMPHNLLAGEVPEIAMEVVNVTFENSP